MANQRNGLQVEKFPITQIDLSWKKITRLSLAREIQGSRLMNDIPGELSIHLSFYWIICFNLKSRQLRLPSHVSSKV
jgi:hypothetical protein